MFVCMCFCTLLYVIMREVSTQKATKPPKPANVRTRASSSLGGDRLA